MKNYPIILSIAAIVLSIGCVIFLLCGNKCCQKAEASEQSSTVTAAPGSIVYVRIDTLMMKYDMFSDLRTEFEAKAQSVQEDLNKKGLKLESDGKAFENQINKGLLTRSAAEQQQQTLLQRQQDLQNLAARRQGELQEEEAVLMNRVMDAVTTFLEKYNEEHKFAAILTTSSTTNVVITADRALDITEEVVNGLNAEYAKTRNAN